MRALSLLLVAALIHTVSGAAFLRFINTVPTRYDVDSILGSGGTLSTGTSATAGPATLNTAPTKRTAALRDDKHRGYTFYHTDYHNVQVDRVGLTYSFKPEDTQAWRTAEVVWTETLAWLDLRDRYVQSNVNKDEKSYFWANAMPPLRAYHTQRVQATAGATSQILEQDAVDRVCDYNTGVSDYLSQDHTRYHWQEHSQLKADGIGLYLSFAAGEYSLEAYGVKGKDSGPNDNTLLGVGNEPYNNVRYEFPTSRWTFTFEDNKVYTLIATGEANWGSLSSAKHAVRLKLLEEDTSKVSSFGKAAMRFFHAITPVYSTKSIDIYDGKDETGNENNGIVNQLAYEKASPYVDVAPGTDREFPVGSGGSGVGQVFVSDIKVKYDIRAGMRVTVICAQNSDEGKPFCRMIPSRIVAYVRLVNDMAGWGGLVQGRFGPQKFSDTELTVWASYEQPDITRVIPGSRNMGLGTSAGSPVGSQGLYPVVAGVKAGSVSGYGEVFVPLYIMDYAVRPQIWAGCGSTTLQSSGTWTRQWLDCTDSYDAIGGKTNNAAEAATANFLTENGVWYEGAPVFKRASFIIKTDGHSTINAFGQADNMNRRSPDSSLRAACRAGTPLAFRFVEPGAFYSLYVTPIVIDAGQVVNAAALTVTPKAMMTSSVTVGGSSSNLDLPWNVKIGISCDRDVGDVATTFTVPEIRTGRHKALLIVPQFDGQQFYMGGTRQLKLSNTRGRTEEISFSTPTVTDQHQVAYQDLTGAYEGNNNAAWSGHGKNYRTSGMIKTTNAAAYAPYTDGYAVEAKAGWTYNKLDPDTYDVSFVAPSTNPESLTVCDQTIPSDKIVLAEGTINYLFIMNRFGCRYDTLGALRSKPAVSELKFLPVVASGDTGVVLPTAPSTDTPFFGAASSVTSSVLVLIASIVAAMALLI
jgi:hypothetical protein